MPAEYSCIHVGSRMNKCMSCQEAVMQDRPEDLYQGTCMLYSLFNLDPHGLTLALLGNILPGQSV